MRRTGSVARFPEVDGKQRNARMRDVAALAGVSTMTVSRVLNENVSVADDLRKRVWESVQKLRYTPNEVARSLRAKRSGQVALILPNLYDPFFAHCANAVSAVARENKLSVIITTTDEINEAEEEQLRLMARRNVDGILIIPASERDWQTPSALISTVPIVTLDRPARGSSNPSVEVDNKAGAYAVTKHLIQHDYSRIIHFCLDVRRRTLHRRDQGYRRAMKEHGLPFELLDVRAAYSLDEVIRSFEKLTTEGHFALFCSNNLTTLHALHALSRLGLKIPDDVPLAGFDDFEAADILSTGITVVRQPVQELGRAGMELLLSIMAGESPPRKKIVLPVDLVIRGSCGKHHP